MSGESSGKDFSLPHGSRFHLIYDSIKYCFSGCNSLIFSTYFIPLILAEDMITKGMLIKPLRLVALQEIKEG